MRTVVCTLLSAALFFVSASLIGFWPAAWIAPVPLLWLAYSRAPLWQVLLASFAAYFLGQLALPFAYESALIAIVLAIGALKFALCVFLARFAVARLPGIVGAFAFPAATTGIGYLLVLGSPNGTFGSFADSQVWMPLAIQSAAFFGLWSITFLLGLVASLLALGLARGGAARIALVALGVIVFAANLGFGYWVTHSHGGFYHDTGEKVGLAVNDALIEDGFGDDAASALRVTSAYADAANVLAAKGAETIVLPEKIAILRDAWREAALAPLKAVAAQTGARIVVGVEERGNVLRNTALTINPDGTVISYYKRRMVPGLEHHVPGTASGYLGHGNAVAICKDMDFQAMIRGDAQTFISRMFVPAWDFGADGDLHARMAILRGVENGFAVVRAAKDGLLTVTDEEGHILVKVPSNPHGLVTAVAFMSGGEGGTLYTKIGDVFAWAALALIALLTASSFAVPRKAG